MILWFYEWRFLKDWRGQKLPFWTMRFSLQENINTLVKKRQPEEGGATHPESVPRIQKPDSSWQLNDGAYTGETSTHSWTFFQHMRMKNWINRESEDEQKVWHGQQGLENAQPGGISAHTRCCASWTDSTGKADLNWKHWSEVAIGKPGLMLIININSDSHLETVTWENSNTLLKEVCACSQTAIRWNVEQNSTEKRTRSTYISCFCRMETAKHRKINERDLQKLGNEVRARKWRGSKKPELSSEHLRWKQRAKEKEQSRKIPLQWTQKSQSKWMDLGQGMD